ncbi:hypothetical protein FRB99_005482 [Tulasnella sp. 403]|nr:hypothetical protein FRB99_005482 [Tulasnella sp. 403]
MLADEDGSKAKVSLVIRTEEPTAIQHRQGEDAMDIFASALATTFAIEPASVADPSTDITVRDVVVSPPTTLPANWHLQADAVWRAALYLAEHPPDVKGKAVLELGAASGLPGLVLAKQACPSTVVLTDYPDPCIMENLQRNVDRNQLGNTVKVVGHAWGDSESLDHLLTGPHQDGYDVILGSDILWLTDQHDNLCLTLARTLKRSADASIHLLAGYHTARVTIKRFLGVAEKQGFMVKSLVQESVGEDRRRGWQETEFEDEVESRQWLTSLVLVWYVMFPIDRFNQNCSTACGFRNPSVFTSD